MCGEIEILGEFAKVIFRWKRFNDPAVVQWVLGERVRESEVSIQLASQLKLNGFKEFLGFGSGGLVICNRCHELI